MSQLKLNQ